MQFPITFLLMTMSLTAVASSNHRHTARQSRNCVPLIKKKISTMDSERSIMKTKIADQETEIMNLKTTIVDQETKLAYLETKMDGQETELEQIKQTVVDIERKQTYQAEAMSAFTVDHKAAGEESGTIKFTNTVYDLGGHYSNTSGQFKAEYPGVYAFFLHIYKNYGTSLAKCNIRKNGVNMAYVESLVDGGLSDSNFESSKSLMLQLAKDDIVDVGDCSAVDTFLGGPHTIFSGFLLYLKEETVN